jgi:hypothetical protein
MERLGVANPIAWRLFEPSTDAARFFDAYAIVSGTQSVLEKAGRRPSAVDTKLSRVSRPPRTYPESLLSRDNQGCFSFYTVVNLL